MITHDELMRYIDGELPPDRAAAVERALEESTELRRDYVVYGRMKTDLGAIGATMGTPETVWSAVNRAVTRPLGWLLFLVGAAAWLGYAIHAFLTSTEPIGVKLATSAVVVGLAMLLVSVIVDRLRDLRTDPYRNVER